MKNTSEVHDLLASNRAHKRGNIAQLDTIESKMFYGGTHRESARKNTNSNEVYDVRIQELANTLAKVFAAIKNDELLSTMMDDPTSKKFAEHRVREIIEECISNDRENLLKDLYQQNATLETENYDLEQEYAKVFNEQKEIIFDFNNRIHEMENEKIGLQEQINRLSTRIAETKDDYEQKLKQKETELFASTQSELNELQAITNKVKELETKLKESDRNYLDLSHDYAALQGELNIQRNLNKENQSREDKQLREENARLYEENRQLKHSLKLYEEGKKAFEDGFKKNVEEIEKGIKVERETYKQNLEKMQKRYDAKIEQYKTKINEYKEKLGEKQKELEEVISKSDQEHTMYQQEIELLESRLEEERGLHQQKLIRIEEEEYQRLNESSLQYESQISKLKIQFEDMLNEKVHQIQEEARSLHQTPRGDTARFMNTDYVKLSHHEEVVEEKTNIIKKLNKELTERDYSFNSEITNKLKDLERRLTEEFELKQTITKRTLAELENHLTEAKAQKKRVEASLSNLEGENTMLKQEIDAIVIQKKNLLEAVEEWCSKAKRLNISYEEEKSRAIEMEDRIAEFQENYDKLKNIVQSLREETSEKDLEVRRLNEQLTILEGELVEKERHFKASDMDAKNLEYEYTKVRDELDTTRKFEIQTKMKVSEGEVKMRQLSLEIEDSQRQNTKLKSQVESLNNRIDDLNLKHSKTEANWVQTAKERDIAQRNFERALSKISKISQNKQQVAKVLSNKLEKLKMSFQETENVYKANISRLLKENEKKMIELVKFCSATIEKNGQRHAAEKESLRQQAQRDLNYHCEVLKERNNKLQRDMSELYEQKFLEKDRAIQNLQDMNRKFNEKLRHSEESLEKLEVKYNRVIEEKERILKEKEQVDANFEQQRQRYLKEIDRFNKEMKKSSKELASQKTIMEEEFYNQVNSLLLEVDVLKRRHHETLSKYANQVQEISEKHREEAERIEIKYKEEIEGFEDILAESKMVEQELAKRTLNLTEKAEKLERQNKHLEAQVRTLEQKEDDYLSQYETKMEELRDVFEKENTRMSTFKSEKFNEISKQKSTIQMLEKEIVLKDKKIDTLAQEKEVLKQHLQDSLSQHQQSENQLLKNKQNSAHVSLFHNKETKKLDFGMVDSLSNAFSSPKVRTARRYEKENVSQNESASRSVRK